MIGNNFSLTFQRYAFLVEQTKTTKNQMDQANFQISTGKRARTFTEQPMATTFVMLKSQIGQQTQYIANTTTAQVRLKIADQALAGIEKVANEGRKAATVTEYNPEQYAFLSSFAKNSFDQVVDFLNSRDDNGFIFGGLATDRLPVQLNTSSAADSAWSKLPANVAAPAAHVPGTPNQAEWGSQALSIFQTAQTASTATGATPASVVGSLPANTPSDVVTAAQTAAAAGGATPATVLAAIEDAIDANVRADVYPNGTATTLPGNYFSVWEDTSTVPSTFQWLTGAAQTTRRPEYADFYYNGGPGVDPRTGANVDGLQIQIDQSASVNMGFSAEENAFEKILRGLNLLAQIPAPANVNDPTETERAAYMFYAQAAQKLLVEGTTELDSIRLRASSGATIVKDKATQLASLRNTTQDAVDPLENVDKAEAIATLQSLETSLNASYSVISRIQNNTLLNFL